MRKTKTPIRPLILTIGGSDSSGMSGIQIDNRTQHTLGVHCTNAITATIAKNNAQIFAINPVSLEAFNSQLDAGLSLPIDVIKVGYLCTVEQVERVSNHLKMLKTLCIYDSIISISDNTSFGNTAINDTGRNNAKILEFVKSNLLPHVDLTTPNIKEAELLSGLIIKSSRDIEQAAKVILKLGTKAVLIKGGQRSERWSQDFFCSDTEQFWLSSKKVDSVNTQGTGCALASSIASSLALQYSLYDAIVIGKMTINQGIRLGYSTEIDCGPVCIQAFPDKQIDLPLITSSATFNFDQPQLPTLKKRNIGLYPIVDSVEWIKRLVPLGIETIQLKVREDANKQEVEEAILSAIRFCQEQSCQLFIHKHWELAIKHKAYGIHLDQEDLAAANIELIKDSGLRLGIGTQFHYQIAQAHSHHPSYILIAPIFPLHSAVTSKRSQGVDGLYYWRQVLNYPLIAGGGISLENLQEVLCDLPDGIAINTAISQANEPEKVALEFMEKIKKVS